MSKWLKFNVGIFLTIVVLAIVLKLLVKSPPEDSAVVASPTPTVTASTSPSPQISPSPAAGVLGVSTTTEPTDGGTLAQYESTKLKFSAMLPAHWILKNDVLYTLISDSTSGASTENAVCTFAKFTAPPDPQTVTEQNVLSDFDLPQVEYFKIAPKSAAVTNPESSSLYVLKNEENIPKLTVTCLSPISDTERFYMILRSIRFSE
jgi:hypothetical protein